MILIAVALFAALSYAVTQSGRGGGNIDRESGKLLEARANGYLASILTALNRLQLINQCSGAQLSFEHPDGSFSNPSAPADKSCNIFDPNGGGVVYQNIDIGGDCPLTGMALGQNCKGVVYAGISDGRRVYAFYVDSMDAPYNNGTNVTAATAATSDSDGLANTDILIAGGNQDAPHMATIVCRALGANWYLPAFNELNGILFTNKNAIGNFANANYVSSSELSSGNGDTAKIKALGSGGVGNLSKQVTYKVRCVRRDT